MAVVDTAVPIPGGAAQFYAEDETTAGRVRGLELHGMQVLPLVRRLVGAREIRVDGVLAHTDRVLDGPPVDMTAAELADMRLLNDEAVLAFLKSWTLDLPLPTTVEDLHALPPAVYDAVSAHAGKLAANRGAGFAIEVTQSAGTDRG